MNPGIKREMLGENLKFFDILKLSSHKDMHEAAEDQSKVKDLRDAAADQGMEKVSGINVTGE